MTSEEKMVSVILPVYNAENSLKDTIDSALSQSHLNLELIIIDDCSTDGSLRIARQCAENDARIRVLNNCVNRSVAFCRNCGIEAARGEYIAFLDSDDIWVQDKLERQISLLIETGSQFTCASYDFIDSEGKPVLRPHYVPDKLDFQSILRENVILCSSVCVDAALLKEHIFRDDYYHEDYVLWLELFRLPIRIVTDRSILTHYRFINTSRSYNKLRSAKERWRIYRDFLNMSIFESLYYISQYAVNGLKKYHK